MAAHIYAEPDMVRRDRGPRGDPAAEDSVEMVVDIYQSVDDFGPGPQQGVIVAVRDDTAGRQAQAVLSDSGQRSKTGRRTLGVVAGCLGILCIILMAVTIAQAVHYRSPSNSMTNDTLVHHYNTLKSNYDNLTLDYTQINILNTNLNREKDLLQSEVNQLKTNYSKLNQEKNQLTTAKGKLNQDKNRLESDNTNLNREKDQLKREVNQLKTNMPCPSGWKKFAERCYYRTTGEKTWQQSRDDCQSLGANLVVINSIEEQVFIRGLRTGGLYGSWIGLTRTQGSWTWTWVDGTPLTTEYWGSGYHRNNGDWNCAAYWHGTDPGKWYNGGCSAAAPSICESK